MSGESWAPLLLGNGYREQDYSVSFRRMVNRVTTKICLRRGRKKLLKAQVICADFKAEEDQRKRTSLFGDFQVRKNSPNRSAFKFFSTPRASKVSGQNCANNDSLLSIPKFQVKLHHSKFQGKGFRCVTEYSNPFTVKLSQKIAQNSQCLKAKSFKIQERGLTGLNLNQEQGREVKESFTFRKVSKGKNNIAGNRLAQRCCQSAFSKEVRSPRASSLPIAFNEEFRPWETKEIDEFAFL